MKIQKTLFCALLILISVSVFSQKSKFSLEAGAGAGYYSNIGVWGLKYNNGINYQFNKKFSISGNLGFYQSLIDFQNEPGVNNSYSNMMIDCDLNYNILKSGNSKSLWLGAGLTYFKGIEIEENSYPVLNQIDGAYISTMGFNVKMKYVHPIGGKLWGAINAEAYSRESLFNIDVLLINFGYSLIYKL